MLFICDICWISNPTDLARPTTFTSEHLAHFSRDAYLPSATSTITDSQTTQGDSDHPVRAPAEASYTQAISASSSPCSRTSLARATTLPAASSSLGTPVVTSASNTDAATQAQSSPTRISTGSSLLQTASLTTEAVDASTGMESSRDSQISSTSSLSPLTSTGSTPRLVSHSPMHEGQPHAGLDAGTAQMTFDTDNHPVLVAGDVNMHVPELIPATAGHHRQSTPVEAGDGGLPSGLPTPPSETITNGHDTRMVHRSREHGASLNSNLDLCTHATHNYPVVPTPPLFTPGPLVEDRVTLPDLRWGSSARQGSLRVFSRSLLPLTLAPLSPRLIVENPVSEEGVGDVDGRLASKKATGEDTHSLDHASGTVVSRGDGIEGPAEGVETSTSTMDLGVPAITVTDQLPQSITASSDNPSSVSQMAGDTDLYTTPQSSLGQSNLELPECHPDADGIVPAYSQTDGYDFNFSSPSPPTSATPSRYETPSGSSSSRPTPEEDEVWGTLMLGASGVSTPLPGSDTLPLMFLREPSRHSSVPLHAQQISTSTSTSALELFAVDPSLLHCPPLLPQGSASESQSSPQDWNRSLSSLTSLDSTDKDDAESPSEKQRARAHAHESLGSDGEGCRPESQCDSSSMPGPDAPHAESAERGASEASGVDGRAGSRSLGGPSASLDELVLLARREPLKIHLKLPERLRDLKRKRDAVDREGEEAGREADGTGHEYVRSRANRPVDGGSQEGQEEVMTSEVCRLRRL